MPYQEKSAIVSLVSGVIVFALYYYFIRQMYQAGTFEGPGAGAEIGKSILWLIFGGIVVNIIGHIVFSIIYAIANKEADPSIVIDERDKLIELRALRVAYYIFGAGFVAAMIALAVGQTYFLTFNILIFSFFIAGVAEVLMQLFLYRRGF
ncbi:MAG: hypothetical protein L3J21_03520 [Devosiaceae bacterium]|nr:hypothetical protein [Devosiaceae bacterium]